jgi:drug/metabolite transporter (DMT)-like permease
MRTEAKGALAVLVAAAGYGTLPILLKLALAAGAGVWPLLAWRFLLGAAFVWIVVAATRQRLPSRGRVPALLGLGVLYAANAAAFLFGLQWVSAATAVLVFFPYPAVVVLLSRIFFGEPLTTRRLAALTAALAGCMLTAGAGLQGGQTRGILLILVAMVLLSVSILISAAILRELPELGSLAFVHTGIAVASTMVALSAGGLALGGGSRAIVIAVALGLVATALPVTLFLIGIKWIGPARAAIYSTVEPLLAVSLAAIVLGEHLGGLQVVGGLLVVVGVVWLSRERLPGPPAQDDVGPA